MDLGAEKQTKLIPMTSEEDQKHLLDYFKKWEKKEQIDDTSNDITDDLTKKLKKTSIAKRRVTISDLGITMRKTRLDGRKQLRPVSFTKHRVRTVTFANGKTVKLIDY